MLKHCPFNSDIHFFLYFRYGTNNQNMSYIDQWNDVKPTMISDEETVGNKCFKQWRPDWRGPVFNAFMDELDLPSFYSSKQGSSARNTSQVSTPQKSGRINDLIEWKLSNWFT